MVKTSRTRFKLAELARSPLMRALAIAFIVLAILEALFISVLCFDITEAERWAAHEFAILKASGELSQFADTTRKHRRVVDSVRRKPREPESMLADRQSRERVKQDFEVLNKDWRKAGLNDLSLSRIWEKVDRLCESSKRMFSSTISDTDSNAEYLVFLQHSKKLYERAMQEISKTQELVRKNSNSEEKQGIAAINPHAILTIAAALSGIICILIAYLINRGISEPIRRLADNCRGLAEGVKIPAPKEIKNEIGSLENAFHEMSETLYENEERRKSFLQLFRLAQASTLENARKTIDLLTPHFADKQKTREMLELMMSNLDGMLELLQSLTDGLSFNVFETVSTKPETINSTALVKRAAASVSWLLIKRNISLVVSDSESTLVADPHLIVRVMTNLISNAIKFSPTGATIQLSTRAAEGNFEVEITDQGPGISEENVKRLFQKFEQVESADGEKRAGSGLGLLICKQFVEAHGGRIGCKSEVGKGSCFWFSIPLQQAFPHTNEYAKAGVAAQGSEIGSSAGIESKSYAVSSGVGAAASEDKSKSQKEAGSVRWMFMFLLALFLLCQFSFIAELSSRFHETAKRATEYSREKNQVIETQDLVMLFLNWRQKSADAIDTRNFIDFINNYPMLKRQVKISEKLSETPNLPPEMHEEFSRIAASVGQLNQLAKHGILNRSELSESQFSVLFRNADNAGNVLENSLFKVLAMEREQISASYDLAASLRQSIISILIIAGLANLILLLILTSFGMRIVDKISTINAKARLFATGGVPTLSISGTDELAYLDQQLCSVSKRIRDAESQRQTLIALINHDLRTPLGSILGGLEIFTEGVFGELAENERTALIACSKDLHQLMKKINNLLSIEKVDAGAAQLNNENLVLDSFAKEFLKSLQNKSSFPVEILFLLDPAAMESVSFVDREMLEYILSALVENAADVSPAGSHVILSLSLRENRPVFQVQDSGPGISPELRAILFDRFRTLDQQALTGLGLPLAMRYARLLSAELSLKDSSAEGSTFELVLPPGDRSS